MYTSAMRQTAPAIVVCFVALLMGPAPADASDDKPTSACKKRWSEVAELEKSLKGERKIPYDPKTYKLKTCHVTQPLVSQAVRRAGEPSVAIIVFDVRGSGRVVEQQLIGKRTAWAETAQQEVSRWLFEPLIESDIGITRVGVTVALIAELEGRGRSCGKAKSPVAADFEIRVCASR
jgi:hypothetical protein